MTQPSPQDDLPPTLEPLRSRLLSYRCSIAATTTDWLAALLDDTVSELDRLRAERSSLWRMLRRINVRLDGAAVLLKQTCPGEASACVYDVREAIRLLETTAANETEPT